MNERHHILVVDDDSEIRSLLGDYLRLQGFAVSLAADRREFDVRVAENAFDLLVLDVMLPDGSGLDICRSLHDRHPNLPIILLTALREDFDRIIGLEVGADDYIAKPFNPRELVARIRAVLRRTEAHPDIGSTYTVFRFAGFTLDVERHRLLDPRDNEVELTSGEFGLLQVFVGRPGRLLSRDHLLDLTQGRDRHPADRSVDIMISRLRRKLGKYHEGQIFRTVRNGGYQLAARVEKTEVPGDFALEHSATSHLTGGADRRAGVARP